MAQIQQFHRLIKEDFEKQYQPLIDKIGYSLNSFADDVTTALAHNLSVDDNLNMAKVDVKVNVDASGSPKTVIRFRTGLSTTTAGLTVIKATNTTATTTYPTATPFISWVENGGIITVNNITGLPANNDFTLKLLLIG